MLILIAIFLLCIFIGYLGYTDDRTDPTPKRIRTGRNWFITSVVVAAIIVTSILGASYGSVVTMRKKLVTIEQYVSSISLYKREGLIETNRVKSSELTDMKYNQYQDKLGQMIMDLRNHIIEYNDTWAGKKTLKDNLFTNWFVIFPEDLKQLNLYDYF